MTVLVAVGMEVDVAVGVGVAVDVLVGILVAVCVAVDVSVGKSGITVTPGTGVRVGILGTHNKSPT